MKPVEVRSEHCKIYVEPTIKKEIERFQKERHIDSFSEAGRRLWIMALDQVDHDRAEKAANNV